jgi:hypothetical protein
VITDYAVETWVGTLFGIGTVPTHFYLALLTDEPSVGWDGTVLQTIEPDPAAGYTRQPIVTSGGWTLSNGFVVNVAQLDFAVPTADWGLITNYGLCDDPVAGNLWLYDKFIDAVSAAAGYDLSVPAGAIEVDMVNVLPSIAE